MNNINHKHFYDEICIIVKIKLDSLVHGSFSVGRQRSLFWHFEGSLPTLVAGPIRPALDCQICHPLAHQYGPGASKLDQLSHSISIGY